MVPVRKRIAATSIVTSLATERRKYRIRNRRTIGRGGPSRRVDPGSTLGIFRSKKLHFGTFQVRKCASNSGQKQQKVIFNFTGNFQGRGVRDITFAPTSNIEGQLTPLLYRLAGVTLFNLTIIVHCSFLVIAL